MSGEDLATRVGYKNQSAIGNLENRAGGTGGSRIGKIADALSVPVDWLLRGPDSDNIPFQEPLPESHEASSRLAGTAHQDFQKLLADPIQREAADLLSKMSPVGREQALLYLRFMATQHAIPQFSAGGERDSIPHQKAA